MRRDTKIMGEDVGVINEKKRGGRRKGRVR